MDERDAKLQRLEVHRRDIAFVRGYVTCSRCACNYNCSKPEERTFCQIYSTPIDPLDTDANILRAEACDQWCGDGIDRSAIVTPEHSYRYDKWADKTLQAMLRPAPKEIAMDDEEAFYDAEIAPALAAIGEKLKERGMHIVATVEYAPGERASTFVIGEDACLAMHMHYFSAMAGENVDAFMISLRRHCKKHGISTESSIFLRRPHV